MKGVRGFIGIIHSAVLPQRVQVVETLVLPSHSLMK